MCICMYIYIYTIYALEGRGSAHRPSAEDQGKYYQRSAAKPRRTDICAGTIIPSDDSSAVDDAGQVGMYPIGYIL